jgi:hypothetical protein
MENEKWQDIQKLYEEKFNIPPRIIDLVACDDILLLSVSVLSNETISNQTGYDLIYVTSVIKTFLEFDGWEHDLDINPFFVYNKDKTYDFYAINVTTVSAITTAKQKETSYCLCKRFDNLRKEVNNYYDCPTA